MLGYMGVKHKSFIEQKQFRHSDAWTNSSEEMYINMPRKITVEVTNDIP